MNSFNSHIKKYSMLAALALLVSCSEEPQEKPIKPTRFLLASHSYYTIRYPGLFEQFVDKMSREKDIDYVFFLGDLVSVNDNSEWKIVMDAISNIRSRVYFTPGNHDIYKYPYVESQHSIEPYPEWKAEYISRMGYDYKVIEDNNANFILINSLDSLDNIKEFLERNDRTLENGKPNILMSHHLPWDDLYFKSGWKTWAHKSYRWNEIKPYLRNINHLIAGDRCDHCNSKNYMTSLENGKIGYNTGIGGPGTDLFYVIAELRDGKISLETRKVEVPADHKYFTDWK